MQYSEVWMRIYSTIALVMSPAAAFRSYHTPSFMSGWQTDLQDPENQLAPPVGNPTMTTTIASVSNLRVVARNTPAQHPRERISFCPKPWIQRKASE